MSFISVFDVLGPNMIGPSSSHTAGLVGLVVAAAQDFLHRMIVHALRQTHDVERELGLTAHGVHVAERVGSRNLSVQERIVHDGREEVGRLHERGVLVKHIHACVIALVIADDQTRVGMRAKAFKQVYERSGTDFCAAAGAACKFGQLYFGLHRKISPFP